MSDIGDQPFNAAAYGINTQIQPMDVSQMQVNFGDLVQTPLPDLSYVNDSNLVEYNSVIPLDSGFGQMKPPALAQDTESTFWNGFDGPPPLTLDTPSTSQPNSWAFNSPATPADAPSTIDLSSMNGTFQSLMSQSFPNGSPQEQGGTFFGGWDDNIWLGNLGGISQDSKSFQPDLQPNILQRLLGDTVIGDFHTHPYTTGLSMTFSGDDVAAQIDYHVGFSVVQSDGGNQWLLLSTQQTPTGYVDPVKAEQWAEQQTSAAFLNSSQNPAAYEQAQTKAIVSMAQQYHMVLYQGTNGVFTRVSK